MTAEDRWFTTLAVLILVLLAAVIIPIMIIAWRVALGEGCPQ